MKQSVENSRSPQNQVFQTFVQSKNSHVLMSNNTIVFVLIMPLDFLSQMQQSYCSSGSSFVDLSYTAKQS